MVQPWYASFFCLVQLDGQIRPATGGLAESSCDALWPHYHAWWFQQLVAQHAALQQQFHPWSWLGLMGRLASRVIALLCQFLNSLLIRLLPTAFGDLSFGLHQPQLVPPSFLSQVFWELQSLRPEVTLSYQRVGFASWFFAASYGY